MQFANLSYRKELPPINEFRDVHVLDLLCNPNRELIIDNFPNLVRLRASRSDLTKIHVTNCPNLEIIDISQNMQLTDLHFSNLPKLRTLDLRNTQVTSLNFSLPSLEYLDASNTSVCSELPDSPNLLAFDNSGVRNRAFDVQTILSKYQKLERLRVLECRHFVLDLNQVCKHPTLEHLFVGSVVIICDSLPNDKKLDMLVVHRPSFERGNVQQLLDSFHCVIIKDSGYLVSSYPEYKRMKWEEAALLLYGPWGIPECDIKAKVNNPIPFDYEKARILMRDVKESTMSISEVKDKYEMSVALDHMMGAVFGSGLGDCIGMSSEFNDTEYVRFALDVPVSILWNFLVNWEQTDAFHRGTITDDTEQAVMIMRTLGDCDGELNLGHFAFFMKEWMNYGIIEHGQDEALDVGDTTRRAICSKGFVEDPLNGSSKATKKSCGNGCAMRTAPVGCFKFWDLETVAKYAINFGCVTHYNDICAVCTVLCSLLIAKNIQRYSLKENLKSKKVERMSNDEINQVIDMAFEYAKNSLSDEFDVDASKDEIMRFLNVKSFDELKLSGKSIGYVLRATGAAVLALRLGLNYQQTMEEIVRWGGDADTNAAVAGGIIGAVVGFNQIPSNLMKFLFTGNWEFVEFARMCQAMKIEPPTSPFMKLSFQ